MDASGVADLSDEDVCAKVDRWLRDLKSHYGTRPATAQHKNRFLGFAKALSRWAVRRRLIPLNRLEAIDPEREAKPLKETYTVEELRLLLAPERESNDVFIYIALLAYLGCRPSEAKNLTWKCIDLEASVVHFAEDIGGNKLKRGYDVPLPPELADILRSTPSRGVGSAPIIPERYALAPSHHGLHKAVIRYLRLCGVEPRNMPRHAFRNTCASLMTAIGVPWPEVRSLLNHEDMRVAADYARGSVRFRNSVKHWPRDFTFYLRRPLPSHVSPERNATLDQALFAKKQLPPSDDLKTAGTQ